MESNETVVSAGFSDIRKPLSHSKLRHCLKFTIKITYSRFTILILIVITLAEVEMKLLQFKTEQRENVLKI